MRRLPMLTVAVTMTASLAFAGSPDCPGDATGDGIVDVDDLMAVILAWGSNNAAADVNDDGFVDVDDLTAVFLDWGCESAEGTLANVSGTVTNLWTGDPIAGAAVQFGDDVFLTDGAGVYSGDVTSGDYEVLFTADYFNEGTDDLIVFPGIPATLDMALEPTAPVIVEIALAGDTAPGGMIIATAEVTVLDGSAIDGYAWTQTAGAAATLTGADSDTAMVELADSFDYKTRLFELLSEPPIGPEDLPPNIELPEGAFPARLQNRFQVVGLNPFVIERTGHVALAVDVTTTSGVYSAEDDLETHLTWKPSSDIRNVPIRVPVLLHGKEQGSYDWSLTRPTQSSATLIDGDTQNPEFTPDWAGVYDVTVTDQATGSPLTIRIYAGNWRGVIVGQDEDGRPVSDTSCTNCHFNLERNKFEPWAQTGHAEIFTTNLNTSAYWGPQCMSCHGVGYDPEVTKNGLDEPMDWEGFNDAGLVGNPDPDNWTTMLEEYPASAQRANVQCENCHGPQWGLAGVNTLAHSTAGPEGTPRVSLASEVCGTCHGEPLRHARFQQWQLSAHANYDVALDEGESGNCSRCHTVNGFLEWLPILLGDEAGDPLDSIDVTWTADEIHPQTCVTCHDPHSTGTTSGLDTDATVRISGNTPPLIAGFTAYGVGRGAICMTCHNSRRGLRNDDTFDEYYGTPEAARAAHGSAQADLLMGENAYLVTTGIRGPHSLITDACVGCHMEATPPPDALSYNQGGTNHTFAARTDICADCHGDAVNAEFIQTGVQDALDELQVILEGAILDLIGEQTAMGRIVDLNGDAQIMDAADVVDILFGETRGRQAITVTLVGNVTVGPIRLTDVAVLDDMLNELGDLYDFADPNLPKAGWNWSLVHNDGSLGVHNPTYAFTVLTAAITALDPEAAEMHEAPSQQPQPQITQRAPLPAKLR